MFKNYLKVTFRNFIRHKAYSFINIAGLGIGMACCLLIILFVQDELRYDTFHQKADRIYRVTETWSSEGLVEHLATVPFPVGRQMLHDFPEVVNTVKFYRPSAWGGETVVRYQDQVLTENEFVFAEASFFDLFDFELVQGSKEALQSPDGLVITESTAKRYFGSENPIGKRISLDNQIELEVAAVLRDLPSYSHLHFDFVAPFTALRNWWGNWHGFDDDWVWQSSWTYLLLQTPDASSLEAQLPSFVDRHFPDAMKDGVILSLQRLTDIHLHSQLSQEWEANGNITYVYIFSAIALAILLIACINFMNLATARSTMRAKEVGLRKVLGADRLSLVQQFLGETILYSLFALLLAIALIEAVLPWFNGLTGKTIEIRYFENWVVMAGLIGVTLFVGLIAGFYPAFVLSAFRPVDSLKSRLGSTSSKGIAAFASHAALRKALVVSQFVVSLVLLISISVIYSQLRFLQNKDLGFNKEQVLLITMYGNLFQQYQSFKNELLQHPEVLAVSTVGGSVPGAAEGVANAYRPEGMEGDKPRWIGSMSVSHDIEEVFGLEFLDGRPFSIDFPTDSSQAFIVNETAANEFGWGREAVGKQLERVRTNGSVIMSGKVVGLVKDFHYEPLHEDLKPLIMRFGGGNLAIRVAAQEIPLSIAHIQQTWEQFVPEWPLDFRFLDEDLDKLYHKEAKLGEIVRYFALLAILIACLGLFGLSSFTIERRVKEIGVRKVLGASVTNLVLLLSNEFTRLVGIAFLIAIPIAYFAMERWLEGYAYQIDIGVLTFLVTGLIALAIALVTVSVQTIRAALSNPVDALRYE